MKHVLLNLTLLLSSFALTTPQLIARVTCPCVGKNSTCACTLRGECNCAAVYEKEGTVPASCPCAKTDCCSAAQTPSHNPVVEVSYGELFDKVTILEIKEREIHDEQKKNCVVIELGILNRSIDAILEQHEEIRTDLLVLKAKLGDINWQLWQVEDAIRLKEATHTFDEEFIQLARSVYTLNNERMALKTKISQLLNSQIMEVKSYALDTIDN